MTAATPGQAAHQAETVAIAFHQAYEELAPQYGYRTREASAKPWDEVPAKNAALMVATAARLLETGVISVAAQEPHAADDAKRPWLHNGCGGTVTFDISGGWCGVCEAEGLSEGDYAQEPKPEPPTTAGIPLRSDAETAAMLRADLADAEAQLARWPKCPAGCSCRIGTDDADRNECGCDGPCNGDTQPAPELAAATDAPAALARVLSWFEQFGTRRTAIATRAQLAHAYQDGGLTVPEELRRFL